MKIKMAYYHIPLDGLPHGQPQSLGAPYHCLFSGKTSYYLTAVREATERGYLKGELPGPL
jgi:hypothetical protein